MSNLFTELVALLSEEELIRLRRRAEWDQKIQLIKELSEILKEKEAENGQ